MIITKSFLQQHTAGPEHAVALNKAQAKILGMKHPLHYGWLQTIIGTTITTQAATKFIEAKRITFREYCLKYGNG